MGAPGSRSAARRPSMVNTSHTAGQPRAASWSGRVRVVAAWATSAVGRVGGLLVVVALARVALTPQLTRGTVLLVSATALSANVATAVAEATYREDRHGRTTAIAGTGWAVVTVLGGVLVGLAADSIAFGATATVTIAAQAPIADLRATYLMKGDLVRVYLPPLGRDLVLLCGILVAGHLRDGATVTIIVAFVTGVVVHYLASGGGRELRMRSGEHLARDATVMLVGQTLLVASPFVDRAVLSRFHSAEAVGTFEYGDRIGYTMLVVVWGGVMSELLRRWRSMGVDGEGTKVDRELKRLFALAVAISIASVALLTLVGRRLTVLLYGQSINVGEVHATMVIATAAAGFITCATLATRAMLSRGQTRAVATLYASLFAANLIGDVLVVRRFGAPGVAAVTATNYLVIATVSLLMATTGHQADARHRSAVTAGMQSGTIVARSSDPAPGGVEPDA